VRENQEKKERKVRRYYDEEFKRNAVQLLEAGQRSAVQLARELGVSDCSLGKWKRRYGSAAAGDPATELAAEVAQLRRQLETVSRQRDILKKALAILGQENSSASNS
jgi:transposase